MKQLSCHDLEQTIKDAVVVTQSLALVYLWVDALCIIQDDAEDKFPEIDRMGLVYSNAIVTIVASQAAAAQEGFLRDTELFTTEQYSQMLMVPYDHQVSTKRRILYTCNRLCSSLFGHLSRWTGRRGQRMYEFGMELDLRATTYQKGFAARKVNKPTFAVLAPAEEKKTSFVKQRAWTYQEEVMSQRRIDFGRNMIKWQCNIAKASDRSHALMPISSISYFNNVDWAGVDGEPADAAIWHEVVREVSKRDIKYPSDRLNTVAGIARRVAENTQSEYFAGLWSITLYYDLLWYCLAPAASPRSGPSWTWSSTGCATQFNVFGAIWPLVSLIDFDLTDASPNARFGAVQAGAIQLEGHHLLQAGRIRNIEDLVERNSNRYRGALNFPFGSDAFKWDSGTPSSDLDKLSFLLFFHQSYKSLFDNSNVEPNTSLSKGYNLEYVVGLLLEVSSVEAKSRSYVRIGMFNVDNSDTQEGDPSIADWLKYFLDVPKQRILIV